MPLRHVIALAICGTVATACQAETHYVPKDFETIGEAIQAAADGDTVRIAAGTYREQLVLERSVRLLGAGPKQCAIEGAGGDEAGTVVTVAGQARVAELTIRYGETGILVQAGASLEIEDCRIVGNASDGIGFQDDFNTSLLMRKCVVTGNGDGVDLESTQGIILDSRFLSNRDDGLDYDGDAGVLVHGCTFADNADDGIEIRIARRTHALILDSRFERNGEDGMEVINSPLEGGDYNVLCVQDSVFDGNGRFGVGFVAHGVEQHTGEMSKTAVYATGNTFNATGEADVSPNYAAVFSATAPGLATVTTTLERGDERKTRTLPARVPLLVGIYNLRPTTDGTMALDVEGVAVFGDRLYVADDDAHRIYVLDRRTGRVVRSIPTDPFPGTALQASGPEGLDLLRADGEATLLLADDDGRALFDLSLDEATFGHVLRRRSTAAVGPVEGLEALGGTLLLAADWSKIYTVDAESLEPRGDPVQPSIQGSGDHLAGIGMDATRSCVLATLSAYTGSGQTRRNYRSGFLEMVPGLRAIQGFWHLGPFSNDPRGIAAADGLIYVADGRSDFRDSDTGEMNRGGMKVFVFLLERGARALDRVGPLLPVRRDAQK